METLGTVAGIQMNDIDGHMCSKTAEEGEPLSRLKELQEVTTRRLEEVAFDLCILYSRRCALAVFQVGRRRRPQNASISS